MKDFIIKNYDYLIELEDDKKFSNLTKNIKINQKKSGDEKRNSTDFFTL